jgi:hypothetical protein
VGRGCTDDFPLYAVHLVQCFRKIVGVALATGGLPGDFAEKKMASWPDDESTTMNSTLSL